ncbi:MAG: hypothetical protein CMN30_26710 [Sandaracinus sp.]|nr:hypothetical protein [Sandaracinus sp.]
METDPELERLAAEGKRRKRLLLAIVLGNTLVALILVGGPYLRGRQRALAGREAFGALVACLWGGRVSADPGLALPEGEELAYVDAFRSGPENWPLHCAAELDAVAPARVFWLFPDTRHAEGEVRRAVRMVQGELRQASGADREGTVPSRPRLAVQRLQAAMTLWSQEADVYVGLEDPLLELGDARATVQPERVPLRAAEDAELWMEPRGDGLEVRVLDGRGISWVRVGGGRVDMRRFRRPRLVNAFGGSERWPLLVWSTPDERCGEDCARQATGVAWLTDETAVTPEPRWLAAHPAGAIPSAVRALADGTVLVVSAEPTEGVALRRFEAALAGAASEGEAAGEPAGDGAEGSEDAAAGPAAPSTPTAVEPLPGPTALLADGAAVPASGEVRVQGAWLLVREAGAVAVSRSGRPFASTADLGGDLAFHAQGDAAVLTFDDGEGAAAVRCTADGCRTLGRLDDARAPKPASLGEITLVAYHRADDAQIRVARWTGETHDDAPVPAPCRSEEGGFCGPAHLGVRDGRLVLGARDGTDMWVLETRDGDRWHPLRGLR